MSERFADAALRHLETGDLLKDEGRTDDAAYHYGLVGETALKEAVIRALGSSLPKRLRSHLNHKTQPLQTLIVHDANLASLLRHGRLGGALGAELLQGLLVHRFAGWSLDIRYADSNYCPVGSSDLCIWQEDAVALYNNGVF